ncbi:hypothetical protein [Winogradskyella jejuensis]|uniref:Beta-carotene 15,15'-monooxygenase n=1 Tax=Winogradskyella jejuensis TaxID=1089305 RepID=A0A1M5JLN4_9FLAO|nr:hypothetical protein [Winogradskyella jejuensis]SHG41486.1 hypothetical protein SAMN05444148_0074 [Winogradskyella jejuensis]
MTLLRKISSPSFVLLSFISLYVLGSSNIFSAHPSQFSNLITADVLLTIPFVYLILIRKTDIPKFTVVPVTIIGVVLASYIIPTEHQTVLRLFKTWVLPIIELGIISFVLFKVVKTIKYFHSIKTTKTDFFDLLKKTSSETFSKPISIFLATEIAVIYYGFIYWKKRALKPNEFTYHKTSGSVGLFIAFILIIAAETIGLHAILLESKPTIAWILTILSIYSLIQALGFVKSILKRPISIENDKLYLRYGIMKESIVDIKNIDKVEITSKDLEEKSETKKLSLLGNLESHNLILHFNEEQTMTSLYGMTKNYKSLAISIDQKECFKSEIEKVQQMLTNL